MDHNYTASGAIRIGNCAICAWQVNFCYAFAIGSIAYIKKKALHGVYERVCIKDLRFDIPTETLQKMTHCDSFQPLYIDTCNAFWSEDELVSYNDAKVLVDAYVIWRNANLQEMALSCQQ